MTMAWQTDDEGLTTIWRELTGNCPVCGLSGGAALTISAEAAEESEPVLVIEHATDQVHDVSVEWRRRE